VIESLFSRGRDGVWHVKVIDCDFHSEDIPAYFETHLQLNVVGKKLSGV